MSGVFDIPAGWELRPGVIAYVRRDGLLVEQGIGVHWVIRDPRAPSWRLELCPCCNREMRTARAAMLVADAVSARAEGGA